DRRLSVLHDKGDDQLVGGRRHAAVDTDGRLPVPELMHEGGDRVAIVSQHRLVGVTATISEDRYDAESTGLLGLKHRLNVLDGELICALEQYLRELETATEGGDISHLDLVIHQLFTTEQRTEKVGIVGYRVIIEVNNLRFNAADRVYSRKEI